MLGELDLRPTGDADLDDWSAWSEKAARIRLNVKYAIDDVNVGAVLVVPLGSDERHAQTTDRAARFIAQSFAVADAPAPMAESLPSSADLPVRLNGSHAGEVISDSFHDLVNDLEQDETVFVAAAGLKDALILGSAGPHAAVLLVALETTRHREATAAIRQLKQHNIAIAGFVVIADAEPSQSPSEASVEPTREGSR
jgi:hypothetical protein